MIEYQPGDWIRFNVDFSKGNVYIPTNYIGKVKSTAGSDVFVVCKGIIWMCKWYEIRPWRSTITDEMQTLIQERDKLLRDFANWEAG